MDLWQWCSGVPKQPGLRRPPGEEQRSRSVHPARVPAPEPGSEMGNTDEHQVAFTQKPGWPCLQTDV